MTLVCHYIHELQQKDKKVVLSAKALEMIYHTASSSIRKLISGKQYLGEYALEQVCDKVEAEGKELPFKKKKKLPQRSSGLAKISGSTMEHERTQDDISECRESFRDSREMYGTSQLSEKLKRKFGYEN